MARPSAGLTSGQMQVWSPVSEAQQGPIAGQLNRIMELARHQLEMDVVAISEFAGERQVFRALLGDGESFQMVRAPARCSGEAYCTGMSRGLIPQAVPDTSVEPSTATLPLTASAGIGAYVGVPVHLTNGTLFGSFSCSATARMSSVSVTSASCGCSANSSPPNSRRSASATRRAADHRLIESATLEIALQPVFDVHDGRFLGAEALARFPPGSGPRSRCSSQPTP